MAGGVSLGNAYGQVIIDGAGAVTGIGAVQRGLFGLEGGFLGVNPVMAVFGAGLIATTAAAAGLVGAIGSSVSKAADLQEQLSAVQAVSGATDEEMKALRDTIDDLAVNPDLKVSAFEAADALEKLASNGLDVEDIVGGAAEATVLLANATGADFAGAATTATDVMAIFGIEAENMTQAVDGITSVVNESKFEFADYQLALAQAGGVAASVGVGFDDFNTAIAGISPLFASGSDAGTSFKTMLQNLIPKSNDATDAMRDLGLYTGVTGKEADKIQSKIAKLQSQLQTLQGKPGSFTKIGQVQQEIGELQAQLAGGGQNAFFEANGQMKDMGQIAGILQEALSGLSEEQRNNALSTIFGTDAMRAAVGLAKLGEEGFSQLQAAMGETSAAEAAATRMDNLRGALEIFQGVVEAVQIRVGDKFIPLFTKLSRAGADFLSGNADQIVAFFEGIAEKAEFGAEKIQQFADTFASGFDAGGGGFEGALQGLEAGLATIVPPEAVAGVQQVIQLIRDLGGVSSQVRESVTGFATSLRTAFEQGGVAGVLTEISNQLGAAWPMIQAILATWGAQFWAWTGEAYANLPANLSKLVTGLNEALVNFLPQIRATTRDWAGVIWEWVKTAAVGAGAALAALIVAIFVWASSPEGGAALTGLGDTLGQNLVDGMGTMFQDTTRVGAVLLTLIGALLAGATAIAGTLIVIGGQIVAGIFTGIINAITGGEYQAWTISELTAFGQSLLAVDWSAVGSGLMAQLVSGLQNSIGSVGDAVAAIVDQFNPLQGIANLVPDLFTPGSPTPFATGMRDIADAVAGIPSMGDVFGGLPTSAGNIAAPAIGSGGGGGTSISIPGGITISISGAGSPQDTALAVRRELENLFSRASAGAMG